MLVLEISKVRIYHLVGLSTYLDIIRYKLFRGYFFDNQDEKVLLPNRNADGMQRRYSRNYIEAF